MKELMLKGYVVLLRIQCLLLRRWVSATNRVIAFLAVKIADWVEAIPPRSRLVPFIAVLARALLLVTRWLSWNLTALEAQSKRLDKARDQLFIRQLTNHLRQVRLRNVRH